MDYVAARDEGKPIRRRGVWHVRDDVMTVAGPRKKDPVLRLRRIFVHSSARAQAAEAARAKKLARAGEDLARLERGLGSRHYPDEQAVSDRITAIGRARRVSAYLTTLTGTDPDTGKPTLAWHFDQQALDAEATTDGWYALLTNLGADQADAGQVLRHYKGQEAVERRYQAFKGPLAVTSLYLKSNRRLSALIIVICLALLIFCLIERQVCQALAARGQTKIDGLYAGRPAVPTGKLVLDPLAGIRLIPGTGQSPPTIPQPTDLQLDLLDLLDIDPRDLR
ncbi:IS1634 family transposase [Nonomuraea helvata]|uniref:Transposase n=1 Tax=Nonomuraea helvata TaxID=37484 RepID=A0ABV5RTG9_9ACTN